MRASVFVGTSVDGFIARRNGDLRAASIRNDGSIQFLYESASRALAILDPVPQVLEIDGKAAAPEILGRTLVLPRGQHEVVAGARRP